MAKEYFIRSGVFVPENGRVSNIKKRLTETLDKYTILELPESDENDPRPVTTVTNLYDAGKYFSQNLNEREAHLPRVSFSADINGDEALTQVQLGFVGIKNGSRMG
jgi:hypothetical protein